MRLATSIPFPHTRTKNEAAALNSVKICSISVYSARLPKLNFVSSNFHFRAMFYALRHNHNSGERTRVSGFSLIELLCVVAIISVLTSLVTFSVLGTKSSRDLANAAYNIQGMIEQARTYAMAENTYTWIGFFEENPSTPGTSGTGQVVVSIVASANGMTLATSANAPQLPSANLTQVMKLTKIANVHLAVVPTASVTRPALASVSPSDTYQVGSTDFPNPTTTPWSFVFPLGASTASASYKFTQVIQFSPQGDATRISDNPTTLIEIGLQPAHGSSTSTGNVNFAVLQVAGIGGQVISYRP
jgi:prepilin-type N-terminal cleavage/methylation domain-containing protein